MRPASTFGPSALVTPANALTLARLAATPVLVVMVAAEVSGWAPFALAFLIGATDWVDGWLARRQGTTRSGAFLDPLADKVAVVGVLCALAARGELSWVPVALIAAREVSMQVYRVVMGRRGVSIPARRSAKLKTVVQGIAVLVALAPPTAHHQALVSAVVWLAVVLTLVTGAQYLRDGRQAARSQARTSPPSRGAREPGARRPRPTIGEATG